MTLVKDRVPCSTSDLTCSYMTRGMKVMILYFWLTIKFGGNFFFMRSADRLSVCERHAIVKAISLVGLPSSCILIVLDFRCFGARLNTDLSDDFPLGFRFRERLSMASSLSCHF